MANERCILVGAGNIANAWLPAIQAERVAVAAVVDLRPDAARALTEKYNLPDARTFTDVPESLSAVRADFLIDLTTPASHARVTTAALRAGLHVIGEKPMAASMDEAREMVRTSDETGRLYMVSQSRRWDDPHPSVAATVRAGAVGGVTNVNCDFYIGAHFGGFRDEMDSPLILDMAIHHFDLARYFTGLDAVSVYAEEFNPRGSWYKGAPAAHCLFEMQDGVRFAYRGSWCAEGMHTSWNGDWRVIGQCGTLLYKRDQPPHGQVVAGPEGFHRPTATLDIVPARSEAASMHGALREMLRFLRTGVRPQTECHDNIKSLAMVFAAIESAKRGTRVRV